jgi:hypothetical protein
MISEKPFFLGKSGCAKSLQVGTLLKISLKFSQFLLPLNLVSFLLVVRNLAFEWSASFLMFSIILTNQSLLNNSLLQVQGLVLLVKQLNFALIQTIVMLKLLWLHLLEE